MPINLTYPTVQERFPRSYLAGFVANTGIINMTLVGDLLSYDYLSPTIHIDLVIKTNFLQWSSNVYTLDHIFDAALSQAYVSGVPVVSSQGIRFWPMQTEPYWRVYTIFGLGVDETQTVDLPPPPNTYWRFPL